MNTSLICYASGVWKMCKLVVTQVMKGTYTWQTLTCYLKGSYIRLLVLYDLILRQYSILISVRFPEFVFYFFIFSVKKVPSKISVYKKSFWEKLLVVLCRAMPRVWSLCHFKGQSLAVGLKKTLFNTQYITKFHSLLFRWTQSSKHEIYVRVLETFFFLIKFV